MDLRAMRTSNRRMALVAVAGALAGTLLAACSPESATKASFKAIDITGAEYARTLALPDASGKLRTLEDFNGKVTVVFFGYTQCPDVCPTTLAELAEVKKLLGADGAKVQAVFVTVDPERDAPEVIGPYVANFGADFVALRGSLDQTKAAAKEFKVFFAKVPGKTEGSYTMDHTAGLYVFDPQGRVRLFMRHGGGAEAMASDIRLLLGGA
jgi:protein SCO1/2